MAASRPTQPPLRRLSSSVARRSVPGAGGTATPIAAAIFDLDGVIVDTATYHYRAWKRLAESLDIPFSPADNERLKGVSRLRSLEIILDLGHRVLGEAEKQELAARKNRWYVELISGLTPAEILPGVLPFLQHLRAHGIAIALASASKNAALILQELGMVEWFDAVVDGTTVASAKPDPEVFLTAAQRLGVAPAQAVVFEDAVAGVEAGKRAGMLVVGIGDRGVLTDADLVVRGFDRLDATLLTGEETRPEMLAGEDSYRPADVELNGSRYLLGNGYMGYRGTLDEHTSAERVACTMAGFFDRAGEAWREPVNAPNGLYTRLTCDGRALSVVDMPPLEHLQVVDMHRAVHRRESTFQLPSNRISVRSERFLSRDDVHLACLSYSVRCEQDCHLLIETGIDGEVWDLNGPHLLDLNLCRDADQLLASARTNEGGMLVVVEALAYGGPQVVVSTGHTIVHRLEIAAKAGVAYSFSKFVSIYTSKDGVEDLRAAATTGCARARQAGYDRCRLRHAQCWHECWQAADVRIEGDGEAQLALRYSIFQLLQAAPLHTDRASIPARGISGQTYKGAVFWDTEMFMLPFFLYTQPATARNLVKYRCHTLDGARRKAAEYGYQGAFYAWESQETGDDACTLYSFTDVFSGRPLRTYFREKQIHISADVARGIWQYVRVTGDESVIYEGGAEVILECARFYCSYAYFKQDKHRYELLDVIGPDEYHERVGNNAFTNAMAKHTLRIALDLLERLRGQDEPFYQSLLSRLDLRHALPLFQEMHDLLYVPEPDRETGIIEQFDGYHGLEDVSPAELKARMLVDNEYLGGANGLAASTKILKQADVVTMLQVFRHQYTRAIKEANWAYYEARSEQGSTLSASVYALLAADICQPDHAYAHFMETATVDLYGRYKTQVGAVYLGGMHLGANGGAWMAAVLGFGGLDFDGSVVSLRPALPTHWQRLSFHFTVKGLRFAVEIRREAIEVEADRGNAGPCRFEVAGQERTCEPGERIGVTIGG